MGFLEALLLLGAFFLGMLTENKRNRKKIHPDKKDELLQEKK